MDSVKGLLMAYNQIIDTEIFTSCDQVLLSTITSSMIFHCSYPSFANHIQSVHDLGKLEVIILKKMDFGKDWANEKYTFGKGWDSEKMLQLYIYDHMRKRELHDAASIFAKEANLEMLELVNSEEGLLKEWWNVFWPQFCSRMTNKAEEPRSSGNASHLQMPVTLLPPPQVARVPNYDVSGERSVQVESTCPAGQGSAYPPTAPNSGFQLYIYNHMNKKNSHNRSQQLPTEIPPQHVSNVVGLHEAAKIFAEEANVDMSELDYDDSLLKDWWDGFWTQFCSRMTKQQSPAQSPLQEALLMLESLKRSQPQHVSNVVGQPAEGVSQSSQEMSQRRAGKRPINIDSASILGHSGSKEKGKGPIGFPPVKLPPSEITLVPRSGNSSHLQMPGTIQPPQVIGAYQSIQMEPTYVHPQYLVSVCLFKL